MQKHHVHRLIHPVDRRGRRMPEGTGAFGSITFAWGFAVRRGDDTVMVQVDQPGRPAEVVALFRAVGVAQLALETTICRAHAVGWDPALGAVVFELHRPALSELDAEPRAVPSAA